MEEIQQSVWNFDGAELGLIFQIKTDAAYYLTNWHLENCYWKLRDLRREVDAKLSRKGEKEFTITNPEGKEEKKKMTEKELVDFFLSELVTERETFLKSNGDSECLSRFYLCLENFYLNLCELMKTHGLYFREGDSAEDSFRRR